MQVEDQTYGIPIAAVERILRINPQDIAAVEGKEAILVDNDPVSLVRLSDVLELPRQEEKVSHDEKVPVVILGAGRKRIAFLVDGVVGQQESVVKSLGKQLLRVRNVAGVTILGTGQVIMTLNPADLIKSARGMEKNLTWTPPDTDPGGTVSWVPSGSTNEPPALLKDACPAESTRSGRAMGGRTRLARRRAGTMTKTIIRPAHSASSSVSMFLRNAGFIPCSMYIIHSFQTH